MGRCGDRAERVTGGSGVVGGRGVICCCSVG